MSRILHYILRVLPTTCLVLAVAILLISPMRSYDFAMFAAIIGVLVLTVRLPRSGDNNKNDKPNPTNSPHGVWVKDKDGARWSRHGAQDR